MLGGALWEQTRPAPPTSATASGYSLPTPVKYDSDGGRGATDNYHGLGWQARYGDQGFGPSGRYEQGYLPPMVEHAPGKATSAPQERRARRQWPTPTCTQPMVPQESLEARMANPKRAGSTAVPLIEQLQRDEHRKKARWSTPTCTQPSMPQATLEARMVDGKHNHDRSVPFVEVLQRKEHRRRVPTPVANDARKVGPNFELDQPLNGLAARARKEMHPTPTSLNGLRSSSGSEHRPGMWQSPGHPEYGELSPGWVEWLMGWPIGWTSLEPLHPYAFEAWERGQSGEPGQARWWLEDPSDDPGSGIGKTVPKPADREAERARQSRIAALGNGQVSACAAAAFVALWEQPDPDGA